MGKNKDRAPNENYIANLRKSVDSHQQRPGVLGSHPSRVGTRAGGNGAGLDAPNASNANELRSWHDPMVL